MVQQRMGLAVRILPDLSPATFLSYSTTHLPDVQRGEAKGWPPRWTPDWRRKCWFVGIVSFLMYPHVACFNSTCFRCRRWNLLKDWKIKSFSLICTDFQWKQEAAEGLKDFAEELNYVYIGCRGTMFQPTGRGKCLREWDFERKQNHSFIASSCACSAWARPKGHRL